MPKYYRNGFNSYLLVEGNDDEHVFLSLLQHYNIIESFAIVDKQGIERLLEAIDPDLDRSGLQNLGIVIDADADLAARWQSLTNILKPRYPNIPTQPDPLGTILEAPGRPKVGVWLMPNNNLLGMLEDFVGLLVSDPVNDPLWQLSQKCLNEAQQLVGNAILAAKGRIHTYLAWQDDPGTPLGLAITKRYFDPSLPQAVAFIGWINRLFN